MEREEAKRELNALRQSQMPMLRKIQEIDNILKPSEAQIKAKVRKETLLWSVSSLCKDIKA